MSKPKKGDIVTEEGVKFKLERVVSRDPSTGITIWVGRRIDCPDETEYVEVK